MVWSLHKLESLLQVQNGYAFDSKRFTDQGGVPLIRIRDISNGSETVINYDGEYDGKYLVRAGQFLIGMDGEFRCYEWKGTDALLNQRVCRLEGFSDQLNARFLFYGINKYLKDIEDVTGFATVKHISAKQIRAIEFPLPPIPEQKRIVAILDQAFADIEQARAKTEQNINNARELFESYLQQVFSQRGEGWEEYHLGDICSFKHGFAFKSEYFCQHSALVLLTPGNFFEEGGYRNRGEKQKYYEGPFPNEFLLNKGALLVAMTEQAKGLLGSPALIPEGGVFLHNQRLGLVELNSEFSGRVKTDFLYHLFNTRYFRAKVQETASGVKVRHTSPKKMQAISVWLPTDLREQELIARKLFKLREKSIELEEIYSRKYQELDFLRKSILQKAFAGELANKESKGAAA